MKAKNAFFVCALICFVALAGQAATFRQLNRDGRIKRKIDCVSELNRYSHVTYQTNKTGSRTIQMFAKKDHLKDVFLKIYSNSESLDIEGAIYNNHVKYLREEKITPNLVEGDDFFTCSNDSSKVKEKLVQLANLSVGGSMDTMLPNHQPISFIVTERVVAASSKPETLGSYMQKFKRESLSEENVEKSIQDVKAIFFQLFFTYDIMKKIGLFHGDLHYNNILIENKPIDAIYELSDGTRHRVKSNYTVKIFDFDHSSVVRDLSRIDARLFSITCEKCDPVRHVEYQDNGFEKTGINGLEYNISLVLSGFELFALNPRLEKEFGRILNILLFGSDRNKEGKLWDEIDQKNKVEPSWEGEKIPSDFTSRLRKIIPATVDQVKSDYKIPKQLEGI